MVKKIKSLLSDAELDFQSKSFVLLSVIALAGLFLALISGIILGQSFMANLSVFIEFVLLSGIFYMAVFHNRIRIAMMTIAFFLIFVFLPAAFFTSGGAAGGTPVWFAFTTLYIVMTLSGRPKIFFLGTNVIVVIVCWWIGYTHPETVTEFTRKEAYYDSFFTLLIVGIIMTMLLSYQALLFRRENERVNSQKKEIEELNRVQKRFFSFMSHEIRTPVNAILGTNEMMLRRKDIPEEILEDAYNVQNAGKMLLAIINDILDLSRMEAGNMEIIPVEYRVAEMISEIVNMIRVRAEEKGLVFDVDADPDIPSGLMGDEIRIKQIIINLLTNAVKYTEKGSVKLGIKSEKADDDRIMLIISVRDTGIGIKKELMSTLFDEFKRVDIEKNRNIEGTGLGLSIVKQLVNLMDGEIHVDSVYGEGTEFTVSLLQGVTDPERIGKTDITAHSKPQAGNDRPFTAPEAKILIVDDNKVNIAVETGLLRNTGIQIDTALSGPEALELTLKNKYDCILMDHFMPGMDGIECLKHIRSQTEGMCNEVPVIILTANAEGENQELYKEAGFDGRLSKPVSGSSLEGELIKHIPKDKIKYD
ncbi:MAG: response regulator [Lachnospiraceae bacterium]|nr:response regulator [Lachnospiraceae bacterium]